jgi:hypothetical protein
MLDRILVPLKGVGSQYVATTIKNLLDLGIEKIKYDIGKPYIVVIRRLKEEEVSTPIEKVLYQVYGSAETFELVCDSRKTAVTWLYDMINKIDQQNLFVSYILCDSRNIFLKWLEIEGSMQKRILGIPLYQNSEIPENTFLMFITKEKDCQPEDTVAVNIVRYGCN